ncbi:MAG: selenium-dependent molybdenum cofactor biosynthesis protein YqeB [Anaerolineales bacterium]|nr:selenium-dependent molybdenum cofactor biosynthesis protein YqeB [Anaerolineales bacterium]MCS7247735.1 selenium-dependent molybdenum cofactor biosynthesis protein YqeB [Anaerolineales bacterium]MDW8161545.1 selenium-dependent molybdenum cofactor biosynthesis protein YqeB [Anaerolineales bacterium]MDW8446927.1 selenium-dependent molybdenum cofactor biosynthesis protein YqeB [Anaerolineales bacterium]
MAALILIRGAGEMASGVAYRLHRAGLRVVMTELPQPLAVRRWVCFSEAVYEGQWTVEGIEARRVKNPTDTLKILQVMAKGVIPVLIDPEGESISALHPTVVVDARMLKQPVELIPQRVSLIIGLGPGFTAGKNCHAAIETNRGHTLGRVYWEGSPQADTGIPDAVGSIREQRVLRAPVGGIFLPKASIGDSVEAGEVIAEVNGRPIIAPFKGVVRGLLRAGMEVTPNLKVGDLDPRNDPSYCSLISDKALAIGGAVLEAILSKPNLRPHLWA